MSLLTQASLVLTPTAYKANKLYSVVPSSGNGDMVTTRATTATRVNSSGLVENVATGIPRLDYTGSVPSILLEPQRTNLILNSVWVGGGSLPTSWLFSFSTGTSIATSSIKNTNVTAYRFVTNTQRQEFYQNTILALNSINTLSVYVESVTTAIPVSQLLRFSTTTGTGTSIYLKNNVPILSSENITVGNVYSLQFTCTLAGTFQTRVGCGVGGNVIGDITLSMPQLETGSYATSYIPTTTATVTRNADIISRDNIYTNNIITSAGGTWFVEFVNNFSLIRDTSGSFTLQTSQTSDDNGIVIKTFNDGGVASGLRITKRISDVETSLYLTLTNTVKIAIDWNGTTADVFINGVKVVTATPFTTTNMNYFIASTTDVPKYIKSMILFPTPLTDAECITLTTL
jgi:hypothetical protein